MPTKSFWEDFGSSFSSKRAIRWREFPRLALPLSPPISIRVEGEDYPLICFVLGSAGVELGVSALRGEHALEGFEEVLERAEVPTTMAAMRRRFEQGESLRIAIEAGGQSCWVSELLEELGHDVIAR